MKVQILVNNKKFNTIQDAAKHLGIDYMQFSNKLRHVSEFTLNGNTIKRLTGLHKRKCYKLICKETRIVYNTITELARMLGIDPATISHDLNNNNVYVRDNKHYYRLSEKSNITCKTHTRRKLIPLQVENTMTNPVEVQPETLVNIIKTTTAEDILVNVIKVMLDKKEYNSANTLLNVIINHKEVLK